MTELEHVALRVAGAIAGIIAGLAVVAGLMALHLWRRRRRQQLAHRIAAGIVRRIRENESSAADREP